MPTETRGFFVALEYPPAPAVRFPMARLALLLALCAACDSPEPTPPDASTSSESGTLSDDGESSEIGSSSGSDGTSSESGAPDWDLGTCEGVLDCAHAHGEYEPGTDPGFDDTIWECFPGIDPDMPTRHANCDCLSGEWAYPTFCD